MKCKVCGAESGKYPLCRACNTKKEKGEIIKCVKCSEWHLADAPCVVHTPTTNTDVFLYEAKKTLISKSERGYFEAIKQSLPDGYFVFPQINLASFINRTDGARFHNELFRNVDFLITNSEYVPQLVIEINDQTHFNAERKERDEKVKNICEEAGVPILKLWTSYGVNQDYIKNKIAEMLQGLPAKRIHHFDSSSPEKEPVRTQEKPIVNPRPQSKKKNKGCYIATCVYGSYDCPQVWTLRRFRDEHLSTSWYGRAFISTYYLISPYLVELFGEKKWFKDMWKKTLNRIINKLASKGIEGTPYDD